MTGAELQQRANWTCWADTVPCLAPWKQAAAVFGCVQDRGGLHGCRYRSGISTMNAYAGPAGSLAPCCKGLHLCVCIFTRGKLDIF